MLPGSLNTLKEEGGLYGDATPPTTNHDVEVHQTAAAKKNTFLTDLDKLDREEIEVRFSTCKFN